MNTRPAAILGIMEKQRTGTKFTKEKISYLVCRVTSTLVGCCAAGIIAINGGIAIRIGISDCGIYFYDRCNRSVYNYGCNSWNSKDAFKKILSAYCGKTKKGGNIFLPFVLWLYPLLTGEGMVKSNKSSPFSFALLCCHPCFQYGSCKHRWHTWKY